MSAAGLCARLLLLLLSATPARTPLTHPRCCARTQDNRETAERMLTHGEQLLAEWRHPDPIIGEAYPPVITGKGGLPDLVSCRHKYTAAAAGTAAAAAAAVDQPYPAMDGRSAAGDAPLESAAPTNSLRCRTSQYLPAAGHGLLIGLVSAGCSPHPALLCVPLVAAPLLPALSASPSGAVQSPTMLVAQHSAGTPQCPRT